MRNLSYKPQKRTQMNSPLDTGKLNGVCNFRPIQKRCGWSERSGLFFSFFFFNLEMKPIFMSMYKDKKNNQCNHIFKKKPKRWMGCSLQHAY